MRGSDGVLCSLREMDSGKIRIVLDDVANSSDRSCGPREHRMLFTWKDYEAADLAKPPNNETASFGFQIVGRLLALTKERR